jgi:VanZ family protein
MKTVRRRAVILPLCYMVALLLLSSIPGDGSSSQVSGQVLQAISPQWQNLLHIPLYGGLTLSWAWALTAYPLKLNHRLAIAFVLTLAWAVVDEGYQMSVPGRYGSLTDIGFNILGASCAVALIHLIYKRPT